MNMMQDAKCDYITQFYGHYTFDAQIWLVMEYWYTLLCLCVRARLTAC